MSARMLVKREFLKKWMMGLQMCSSKNKKMSILERKKAIKLSADLAMASAKNGTTCWSRALIASASEDDNNRNLVEHILGSSQCHKLKKVSLNSPVMSNMRIRSKKIMKRSRIIVSKKRSVGERVGASCIAKRLVKKRTKVLKSLVPGGLFMDEVSLIEETLDYIASLRAQVDVMRCLANSASLANPEVINGEF